MTRLLSYDVPEGLIAKLKDNVLNELKNMGYGTAEKVTYEAHISIAQIKGDDPIEKLEEAQQEGKKYKASFKMDHIDYLEGRENLGYVVVKLKTNQAFENYYSWVEKNFDIVTYAGGHKPHISLVTIEKNLLKPEDLEKIKKINVTGEVKPTKIQLWGTDKKILKEIVAERITMKKKKSVADLLDLEKKVFGKKAPLNVVSIVGATVKASTVKDRQFIADKIITASAILKSGAGNKEKIQLLEKVISDLEKTLI